MIKDLNEILGVKYEEEIEILMDKVDIIKGEVRSYYIQILSPSYLTNAKVTSMVLQGKYKYRRTMMSEDTINKLGLLTQLFGKESWVTKDEGSGIIVIHSKEPVLQEGELIWNRLLTAKAEMNIELDIPTNIYIDLSKPIETATSWREITGHKWKEVFEE